MSQSKRVEAMAWWNGLTLNIKQSFMVGIFNHRIPTNLTGREIETIYKLKGLIK